MKILSALQIKEADAYTIEHEPIASNELMERAARACVKQLYAYIAHDDSVLVVCGTGNNGGDGFAITRMLLEQGVHCKAFVIPVSEKMSPDAQVHYDRLIHQFPQHVQTIHEYEELKPVAEEYQVVLDALFGTGLNKPVQGLAAEVIKGINQLNKKIISIDIPSGLFADEHHEADGPMIKSSITLTFQAPKLSFLLPQYGEVVPAFKVVDIGLHPDALERLSSPYYYVTPQMVQALLKERHPFSHKGMYGHALLIAGSRGKSGAALIAAKACLRSGAGLLTVHSTPDTTKALLTNLPEATPFLAQPLMWALLGAITLSVTFLSGFYPALVLSGFEPVKALKSRITFQTVGGLSLRRSLVVLQFVISQLLVIGTVVAIMQMNFVQNIDLGLNKEAVLVTNLPPNDSLNLARYEGLKNQLAQLSTVKSVSFCSDAPSSDNNWDTNFAFDHRKDEEFNSSLKFADADYFKTFGLRLVAGRSFVQSDTSREVVINETMLHKLGYQKPELILGKEFKLGGRGQWKPIVGVVKDFKANSIREAIKPISIHARKRFYNNIAIKIEPTQIDQTEAQIKAIWEKTYPDYVYQSRFFDEQIANFYRQEDRLSLLFRIFAGIAIFIGCLGLYGLVSYMAVQRTKEIGIRKVLGASVGNVVWNFSKEFLLLVGTAFVIAAPIGYYVMSRWLENFVFKIDMGVGVYLIAGGLSLVVALLTMGYKAFQAATLNPVKSLKTE